MDQVYEFTWTAEDFEDLLADLLAFQYDSAYDEVFQAEDWDVWKYLGEWRKDD